MIAFVRDCKYSEWTEVLYSKTEKALEISAYNFFFWYDYYQAGLNTFHQTSCYCVVGEIDVETFDTRKGRM